MPVTYTLVWMVNSLGLQQQACGAGRKRRHPDVYGRPYIFIVLESNGDSCNTTWYPVVPVPHDWIARCRGQSTWSHILVLHGIGKCISTLRNTNHRSSFLLTHDFPNRTSESAGASSNFPQILWMTSKDGYSVALMKRRWRVKPLDLLQVTCFCCWYAPLQVTTGTS